MAVIEDVEQQGVLIAVVVEFVRQLSLEADGIAGAQKNLLAIEQHAHCSGDDVDDLIHAVQMAFIGKSAAGCDLQVQDLVLMRGVIRKYAADLVRIRAAERFQAVAAHQRIVGLVSADQAGQGNLQPVGNLPQGQDGGIGATSVRFRPAYSC